MPAHKATGSCASLANLKAKEAKRNRAEKTERYKENKSIPVGPSGSQHDLLLRPPLGHVIALALRSLINKFPTLAAQSWELNPEFPSNFLRSSAIDIHKCVCVCVYLILFASSYEFFFLNASGDKPEKRQKLSFTSFASLYLCVCVCVLPLLWVRVWVCVFFMLLHSLYCSRFSLKNQTFCEPFRAASLAKAFVTLLKSFRNEREREKKWRDRVSGELF